MKNRHGQMDQDLYIRDLNEALNSAISLLKRQAQAVFGAQSGQIDSDVERDVDNFLYDMEREIID